MAGEPSAIKTFNFRFLSILVQNDTATRKYNPWKTVGTTKGFAHTASTSKQGNFKGEDEQARCEELFRHSDWVLIKRESLPRSSCCMAMNLTPIPLLSTFHSTRPRARTCPE